MFSLPSFFFPACFRQRQTRNVSVFVSELQKNVSKKFLHFLTFFNPIVLILPKFSHFHQYFLIYFLYFPNLFCLFLICSLFSSYFILFLNSSLTLLIDIFPYVALVKFCFPATCHSFSYRTVKFGLRRPCTFKN